MTEADPPLDDDGWALVRLLPADGSPAGSEEVRRQLGWTRPRYTGTCLRLEDQGYVLSGQARGEAIGRDLTAVPEEFRLACGRRARMSWPARCPSPFRMRGVT